MSIRAVKKVSRAESTSDGDGVKLDRAIGNSKISNTDLDPFLMLDHFHSDDPSDYCRGFPSHPHRGFETVTYMLEGNFEHKDTNGGHGFLTSGSIQWMTAGKGIVHSEMPKQDKGLISGFQLWINLPRKDKMCPPRYQDIPAETIPVVKLDDAGSYVKVCCGKFNETTGPVEPGFVKPEYLDVVLMQGASFVHKIPTEHTVFAFVYEGKGAFGSNDKEVNKDNLVIFGEGETVQVTAITPIKFILVSAKPLREPVVQHGPFVMNTQAEIFQAFDDYQSGVLGRY